MFSFNIKNNKYIAVFKVSIKIRNEQEPLKCVLDIFIILF